MPPHLVCVLTLFVLTELRRFLSLSYIMFLITCSVLHLLPGSAPVAIQGLCSFCPPSQCSSLPANYLLDTLLLFPGEVVTLESCAVSVVSVGFWDQKCLNGEEMAQWLRAGLLLVLQLTWVDSRHSRCSSQLPVTPVGI